MSVPELSIIVTCYKHPEMLRLCLRSIRETVKQISYEVIVADTETEMDMVDMMAREFSEIPFISFKANVGFQRLVLAGIERSQGAFMLILNHDIVATEGAIEKLLTYLKEHSEVGVVGPKLLNFNGTPQDSCFRFYRPMTIFYRRTWLGKTARAKRHLNWFLMRECDRTKPLEAGWVMGSVLMVSRAAYEKVGPMDQRYFMYMEDVDWCRRFWEAGYKVMYYPLVSFYHYHGKGSARGGFMGLWLFNRLTWHHIASAYKYFRKYAGKPLPVRQ